PSVHEQSIRVASKNSMKALFRIIELYPFRLSGIGE
ncbi:hypothetical protein LCGC14_1321500, partial [marine sediment metagenome]